MGVLERAWHYFLAANECHGPRLVTAVTEKEVVSH